MQLIVTIFYIVWLCGVLVFLWLIWRSSVRVTPALIDAATKSATAAQIAVEAARTLAEQLREKHP